jgi:hypothetical protein
MDKAVVAVGARERRQIHRGPEENDSGRAQDDLDSIRPRYPGEYSFLGTQWPEMATFLAANRLA